jgi:hypothetical protein
MDGWKQDTTGAGFVGDSDIGSNAPLLPGDREGRPVRESFTGPPAIVNLPFPYFLLYINYAKVSY